MKNNRIAKYFNLGVFFILLGVLCNVKILSIFSFDGSITSQKSRIGIWIFQIFLICLGSILIFCQWRKKKEKSVEKNKKEVIFILIICFFTMSIIFIVPELLLRFLKPQMTYSKLVNLVRIGVYDTNEFNPVTLKKNVRTTVESMEYPGKKVDLQINSLGLRGPETTIKKPNGVKRILILGDSYTYGAYVANNETYPAVLEKLISKESGSVEVLNAGFADGFAPDEHYAWLANVGLSFEPDIIIYGFFIGNDLTDTSDLEWKELDDKGLPRRIINHAIKVDEAGFIRSKKADNRTVGYQPIYRIPVVRESHLCVFLYQRLSNLISPEKSSGNNKGWGKDPFPFIFKKDNTKEMDFQEGRFKKLVLGMSEISKENNAEFMVLMIPINFQVDKNFLPKVLGTDQFKIERNYFEELKPWLEGNNIDYLDLLKLMSQSDERFYPLNAEVHFNPNGNSFAAQVLKQKLSNLNWLDN